MTALYNDDPSPLQLKDLAEGPAQLVLGGCPRIVRWVWGSVLTTVPESGEASVQERLDKVAQLVLASTVREVVAVLKEKEEGKTARSVGAVIGHVGSAVRRSAEWLIV